MKLIERIESLAEKDAGPRRLSQGKQELLLTEGRSLREVMGNDLQIAGDNVPALPKSIPERVWDYEWESPEDMKDAAYYFYGMVQSRAAGVKRQESIYLDGFLGKLEKDYCRKGVRVLQEVGFPAKPFCPLRGVRKGKPCIVKSPKNDWLLIDVEDEKRPIPPLALHELNLLKGQGMVPHDIKVAYAIEHERTKGQIFCDVFKSQAKKAIVPVAALGTAVAATAMVFTGDPILICSFGQRGWYIELFRWE